MNYLTNYLEFIHQEVDYKKIQKELIDFQTMSFSSLRKFLAERHDGSLVIVRHIWLPPSE